MTGNYMIPCGACGALLYLPVGQTTGSVPCECGGWADVAHALRHDDAPAERAS